MRVLQHQKATSEILRGGSALQKLEYSSARTGINSMYVLRIHMLCFKL